jgi:hypothetical protein
MPASVPANLTDASSPAPLAATDEAGGGNSGIASETGGSELKRLVLGSLVLLVLVALVLLIVFFAFLRHWVAVHTGTLG